MWFYRFIWPTPGTLGSCLGEKRPENGRNVGQKTKIDPNRKLCPKLKYFGPNRKYNTSWLVRNAPLAHLGALSMGCQSVVLSVHMAKTRHCGRMFGQKRPDNGRSTIAGSARLSVYYCVMLLSGHPRLSIRGLGRGRPEVAIRMLD